MKIGTKLTLGFAAAALTMAAAGYSSMATLRRAALNSIGDDLVSQADLAVSAIDGNVLDRLEELRWYADSISLHEQIIESNAQFQKIPDLQQFIEATDRDWIDGKKTAFIEGILDNPLSQSLRAHTASLAEGRGYLVFGEIFVANKHGALIGSSGRTSDYYQADESWYKGAVAQRGSWVGNVKFDASSNSLAMDLVVPILDKSGAVLGVLKGVLNIRDVQRVVDFIQTNSPYESTRAYLVDSAGRAVFSSLTRLPQQHGEEIRLEVFGEDLSGREAVARTISAGAGHSGHLVFTEGGKQILAIYCRSPNLAGTKGAWWSLVMEYDADEVLAYVAAAERFLGIASLAATAIAIVLGWLFSRSISAPIMRLTRAAAAIAQGRINTRVESIERRDEVGALGRTFNQMAENLSAANVKLEQRQSELEENAAALQQVNLSLQQRTLALQESERKYRSLVETTSDWVWAIDDQGVYTYVSPRVRDLLGYEPEEILGQTPFDLMPPDEAEKMADRCQQTIQSPLRFERLENTNLHKSGRHVVLETSAVPVFDASGKYLGYQGIDRDITERKQAEREREKLIARLETQNAELERFTYTVSHDLKSPLVTIKGFLGLLEQDLADGDAERLHDDVTRISMAADRMHRLLDELLELSRIGRVVSPSEDVPLRPLIDEVLELMAGQIGQRSVRVDVEPDLPVLHGDRIRLREVLQNLIENAVKNMGDQPSARIEIGARQNDDETTCYVRDNGIGIDPRYHQRIFGLFDKLDPSTAGTGVGLAVVKRAIEVHGGRIWVESQGAKKGSTFYFCLPRKSPRNELSPARRPPAPNRQR